ncbi:MAG: FAD:protein FMN transferase, partial [Actinobacteria bacterium]|nr:FAD:protein FMN transferase [Actinomycetota bacterium]
MGTVFSIDVRSPGVEAAVLDDVIAWLHRVDETFSTYRPESEISRLGRGELRLSECSADVRHVLDRCAELREETGGYFDAHATGRLDPSGYVKGWAIERASERLLAAGAVNHCVNGGGDVQCVGQPAPDRDWTVGIADPVDATRTVAVVSGRRLAVATSGSAQRGGHIRDPNGHAPDDYLSITVVGDRLAEVDAEATA